MQICSIMAAMPTEPAIISSEETARTGPGSSFFWASDVSIAPSIDLAVDFSFQGLRIGIPVAADLLHLVVPLGDQLLELGKQLIDILDATAFCELFRASQLILLE